MSAQTIVYLYNQRQLVILLEPNVSIGTARRYEKVYSKPLTINRGIDNVIEFQFINQNQKPVNITLPSGQQILFRILTAKETLLEKALTPVFSLTGIAKLELTSGETLDLEPQQCYYSLEIPVNNLERPVFVDEDSGARGVLNIVNSVKPAFVPAQNITIPSHLPPRPNANVQSITYYSSVINTTETQSLTLQNKYDGFTGNIQLQGSTLQDFAIYYNIGNQYTYNNSGVINNVAILNNSGYFTSEGDSELRVGKSVTITGTPTGTGAIVPYSSGTVYYITSTNGANVFILSESANGTPVTTLPGTTTGLTFTVNGYTGTDGYTVEGYHPFVRVEITNYGTNPFGNAGYLDGDVTQILARTSKSPLNP